MLAPFMSFIGPAELSSCEASDAAASGRVSTVSGCGIPSPVHVAEFPCNQGGIGAAAKIPTALGRDNALD